MKRKFKKINRAMSIVLLITIAFCLIGCGNTASPAVGEDVVSTEESGHASTEPAEATATSEPTASPSPTASPEPTPTLEPSVPPHVHKYTAESITTQATCAVAGVKTLTCSCGDSKTEQIPATGNHNWVEEMQTITHPSTGHVETTEVQVQVGTTTRTEYACAVCDARFDSPEEKEEHCKATGDRNHAMARTIMYDYPEPVYEAQTQSVWVVDQEAWDETVGSGKFTCSNCGATK